MPAGLSALAGKFIVLDGLDGCGKTTQLDRLEKKLRVLSMPVTRVREPGSTPVGEHIRDLLLTSRGEGLHIRSEMLLYMASRAQLVYEEIIPALNKGATVLADRYTSSTLAYQGTAGGIPQQDILDVARAATENLWPDLTIILDVPLDLALKRIGSARHGVGVQPGLFQDRIENRVAEFHQKVRAGFLEQARTFAQRYRVISAKGTREEIAGNLEKTLLEYFVGTAN
ncbi:MAG: dTMP kinase [Phycisphaerae bacterium]